MAFAFGYFYFNFDYKIYIYLFVNWLFINHKLFNLQHINIITSIS